ncbi:response regulator [Kiloniella litopenaei]|uniref:response regulator n=1 Tax=Kiloniella litopenaei TaxID=1549748 RepID=UPI000696D5BC|nr:response regulator [Kiloniella litopenaei]
MATILCVEDEDALREDLVEELEDEGYTVLSAKNGEEGFKIISENKNLDLVLSDISMPIMNGFELLKQVRENDAAFSDIPFVFLSALSDRDQILEGKKLGVDDYVIKPVDFDLLFATLATRVRQITKIKQKQEKEMVALYKALSPEEKNASEAAQNTVPNVTQVPEQNNTTQEPTPQTTSSPPKLPETGKLVTGRFQLLGLDKLKEKLKDKTDKYMATLQTVIQNVVSKNLSPEDVCKIGADHEMMICFAKLSEEEAAYKIESIKREIWIKVLGEEDYQEELSINSQVYEIEVEEEEYASAKSPWDLIQDRINKAAAAAEERVDIFIGEILERAEVRFTKLYNTDGKPLPISVAKFDGFGQNKLNCINQVIKPDDPRCLIVEGSYIGQTIAYMISNLSDMAAGVVLKISYQLCINKKEFENALGLLEKLPKVARDRMIIAITNIPPKLHLSQLSDLMMRIRPFCKMGMTEFQLEMPSDQNFELVGASILMLDFHEAKALIRYSKPAFVQAIKTLRLKKKKLLITNVPEKQIETCKKLGANFVDIRNEAA